jgi:putative iron-dependent peroxidase
VAEVVADVACFTYHDSRDLTGFIDGTANPPPADAASVACIGPGRPGAGGSHVLTQRWVHDLASFRALEVADQERVIGRTRHESVQLDDDAMPDDAHVARVEIHGPDGEERPIYRRSTPFGSTAEEGLYFVAFSSDRDRFDTMLGRMFGLDGPTDHLTAFSRPVSGSYYFAPSVEALDSLA